MCRLIGVSRNGYYRWLRQGERKNDSMLDFWVEQIFKDAMQPRFGIRLLSRFFIH